MAETPSLIDAVRAINNALPGPQCGFVALTKSLPRSIARDLNKLLTDPGVETAAIARVLDDFGYHCGRQTLQRHRNAMLKASRGDRCACFRRLA